MVYKIVITKDNNIAITQELDTLRFNREKVLEKLKKIYPEEDGYIVEVE